MKKISIDQHTHHLHAEVRQLYESAFPKEEQIIHDLRACWQHCPDEDN